MSIPVEINDIIIRDFNTEELLQVQNKIEQIYNTTWNVGQDQLATSLLLLSRGSIEKLLSYFPIGDPRDIFMAVDLIKDDESNYLNT